MTKETSRCADCKKEKPLADFNKDKQQRDGVKPYCKLCVKKRNAELYPKIRVKLVLRQREQAGTEKAKQMRRKMHESRMARSPEKFLARQRLRHAVQKGDIQKKPCFCGDNKVQAHHHLGYNGEHWKDVTWLCLRHHLRVHGKQPIEV